MFERVRAALFSSYAGAVLVGWTLATGVTNLVGLLLMPLTNLAVRYSNRQTAGAYSFPEVKIFDPVQLGVGAIKALVVLGTGLLLLAWIYIPASRPSVADDVAD